MSKTNKGTDYELFVYSIYKGLLDSEGIQNITVEHNKTDLEGLSGQCHQLDIYWAFELAGNKYHTAIECKDYSKPVDIGRIRNFYGVLADVPKLNGVFVSTNGFQKGARTFAEKHGIKLFEVRKPRSEDFEGGIKQIHLRAHIILTQIKGFRPQISPKIVNALSMNEEVILSFEGTNYDPIILDSEGNGLASIEDIRSSLPHNRISEKAKEYEWRKNGTFMRAIDGSLIPIESLNINYDVLVGKEETVFKAEDTVNAIIKDVKTGKVKFIPNTPI